MNRASYLLLPLLYLLLGGFVTILLVNRIFQAEDLAWVWFYMPILLITVFVTVMGIVNVWIHYRTWNDNDQLVQQIYTFRRMLALYVKCWLIVVSGLLLAMIFFWMQDFIPVSLAPLFDDFKLAFYSIVTLLTSMALLSVVNGENLAETRLRHSQIENQSLRSQLNPHFLYNTLNNIDALIWIDQQRASEAVTGLSQLMRYFTYSSRQDFTPVGEEIAHLGQYIDLQRLRMPSPQSLVFQTSVDDPDCQIAPLMLLPLIENCFKHCGNLSEPRAIVISISVTQGTVTFTSDNNLPEHKPVSSVRKQHHGVGQEVLKRRLDLLYHGRYSLTCSEQDGRYQTSLTIRV